VLSHWVYGQLVTRTFVPLWLLQGAGIRLPVDLPPLQKLRGNECPGEWLSGIRAIVGNNLCIITKHVMVSIMMNAGWGMENCWCYILWLWGKTDYPAVCIFPTYCYNSNNCICHVDSIFNYSSYPIVNVHVHVPTFCLNHCTPCQ